MEPGIKKLTEAVKRDCREGQGCFNPNGCDHEFFVMCQRLTLQ